MLSHLNQHLCKPSVTSTHKRWFLKYRPIQIFVGSCAIALLGLTFFQFKENPSTAFRHNNAPSSIKQRLNQLGQQPKSGEIPGEGRISRVEGAELQTGLYDFEGNLLGSFSGEFQETTPDGLSVITYVNSAERSYVSRLDGAEPKALTGVFQGFSPSEQQMITYHQNQSHLYDLSGNLITSLDGWLKWGTLDGQYLVTDTGRELSFNLYSVEGTLQAAYEGNFRGFALYTPQLIATDRTRSYLYNFDGTLASTFEGEFQEFGPDGKGLVTLSEQLSQPMIQSHLYDLDGTLRASMAGKFAAFAPLETAIITYAQQSSQSWLYDSDGVQQSTFEGAFLSFTPDGHSFFTYGNGISHHHFLDSRRNDSGSEEKAHFEGLLAGITTNTQQLITVDPGQSSTNTQVSRLYSIDGTKLADLNGIFIGFISNEKRIVTSQVGVDGLRWLTPTTYFIYDLAGNLETTLTGQLLGLTQSGRQGLVIYADGETRLYDSFDGSEQAVFQGRVVGFTRDETGVFFNMKNTAL